MTSQEPSTHKATGTNCTLCGLNLANRAVSDDWDDVNCGRCEAIGGRRKPKPKPEPADTLGLFTNRVAIEPPKP